MKSSLIIGLGKSGRSAVSLLKRSNENCVVFDDHVNEEMLKFCKDNEVVIFSDVSDIVVDDIDRGVISPGVPISNAVCDILTHGGVKIVCEMEIGAAYGEKHKIFDDKMVIGITGTNGKTTTVNMIKFVASRLGIKATILGNEGIPLSEGILSLNDERIIILEISSFQLECLHSKFLDAAIILNIFPEHLDRYENFDHYSKTKKGIFRLLKNEGKILVGEGISIEGPHEVISQAVVDDAISKDILEKNIPMENFLATFWAIKMIKKISWKNFIDIAKDFKALTHRMEFVRELRGIKFFNDSKSTNPIATVLCIKFLERYKGVLLIAGGKSKNGEFSQWRKFFDQNVKKIYVLGHGGEEILCQLSDCSHYIKKCYDLQSAVSDAFSDARSGDAVVLSPGCSSKDVFLNCFCRGEVFKDIVNKL